MIGQVLSHYRVTAKLGEGGMGEVYRATDSRLGRDVAIKVLPAIYARDADRMARFEREAQVLASLNHPNIAHIYGVEEANGTCALVMELVEGPTLAERLAAAAMPLEEALANAKSIAEALEYAHERGIVHRDLKPANVKIAPDGRVKLLDFGLARAFEDDPAATDISHSPTLTAEATKAGIILGTAAYMSPEQAKGKAVDRRADIWSFGAVLYEMLAGKQLFSGETSSETLAAVIKDQPDWSALPADIPAPIMKLLRRCLTKDPKQRLRDIGEARIAIEEYLANPQAASDVLGGLGAAPPTWRRALPWAIAGVLAVAAATGFIAYWRASQPEPHDALQLSLVLPEPLSTNTSPTVGSTVALSPDGKSLVYMASPAGKPPQLFLRRLDQPVATPIPGTENAAAPFFSPDGQWIGFFAEGKMLKVPVRGGPVSTVFGAVSPRGASWAADDTIIFVPTGGSGLMRVPAGGGTPRPLTTLNASEHEISHRWPDVLPGGKAVLFASSVAGRATWDDAEISLVSLETGQRRTLIHGGSFPRYVASGHIVYARTGVLMAVPFDLKRLEVTGPPVAVQEGVVTTLGNGAARFAVSESGLLAYVAGTAGEAARSLIWLDRKGTGKELPAPSHAYFNARVSPDGKLAAVSIGSGAGIPDIWVYDFARSTVTRLTFGPGPNSYPVWTPDNKRVIYWSSLAGRASMRWKAVDGSGADEELHIASDSGAPESVSPDGKTLLFSAVNPDGGIGTQVLSLDGELKVRPLLASQFTQNRAQFSPDGHWIVYESNESTRNEIYVQPFPGPGGKWQISTSGGTMPRWSRNGQEIFFRYGNQMMSVPVETRPAFKAGTPRLLFQGNYLGGSNYDVAPDGQHFLMIKEKEAQAGSKEVNVILNWFDDLKRRVPSTK